MVRSGMTQQEIKISSVSLNRFSKVERYIDTPVKIFLRYVCSFSICSCNSPWAWNPGCDEVLAVGDAEFQKKNVWENFMMFQKEEQVIFVGVIICRQPKSLSKKTLILNNGGNSCKRYNYRKHWIFIMNWSEIFRLI